MAFDTIQPDSNQRRHRVLVKFGSDSSSSSTTTSSSTFSMMNRFRPTRSVMLYGFLLVSFYALTLRNHEVLSLLRGIEFSPFVVSPMEYQDNHSGGEPAVIYQEPTDREQTRRFREDLELVRLLSAGDVSLGFEAKYQNQTVVAKIAADGDLYYSDIEISVFRELNEAPTIPNIPKMHLAIRSVPNPFVNQSSYRYLRHDLGLSKEQAKKLIMKRRISVIIMDLLEGNQKPTELEEVQRLMRSLLETMEFVHSRNIMHCDLHPWNYFWDGEKVSIFDWNGAFWYEPNTVKIHYPRTPTHLFPPEARDNTSAVHSSVYAFDVYTMGKLFRELLKSCCGITFKKMKAIALKAQVLDSSSNDKDKDSESENYTTTRLFFGNMTSREKEAHLDEAVALELALSMMIADPFERPNTTEALSHPFFQRQIQPRKANHHNRSHGTVRP